jgi:L-asparaginase
MTIRLLLTGGTFDKEYNELTAELEFDKPHINEMLRGDVASRPVFGRSKS